MMITATSLSGIQWAMVAFVAAFMASGLVGSKNMIISGFTALAGIAAPIWLIFNLAGNTLFMAGAAYVAGAILGQLLYARIARQSRLRQDREAEAKRKRH